MYAVSQPSKRSFSRLKRLFLERTTLYLYLGWQNPKYVYEYIWALVLLFQTIISRFIFLWFHVWAIFRIFSAHTHTRTCTKTIIFLSRNSIRLKSVLFFVKTNISYIYYIVYVFFLDRRKRHTNDILRSACVIFYKYCEKKIQ